MGVSELSVFILAFECNGHATHARQDIRLSPLVSHTRAVLPLRSQAVTARTRAHNTKTWRMHITIKRSLIRCPYTPTFSPQRRGKLATQILKWLLSTYAAIYSTTALLKSCACHQWNTHHWSHLVWNWWSSLLNLIPLGRFCDLC